MHKLINLFILFSNCLPLSLIFSVKIIRAVSLEIPNLLFDVLLSFSVLRSLLYCVLVIECLFGSLSLSFLSLLSISAILRFLILYLAAKEVLEERIELAILGLIYRR